jgi:hypothetical protein
VSLVWSPALASVARSAQARAPPTSVVTEVSAVPVASEAPVVSGSSRRQALTAATVDTRVVVVVVVPQQWLLVLVVVSQRVVLQASACTSRAHSARMASVEATAHKRWHRSDTQEQHHFAHQGRQVPRAHR